MAFCNVLLQNYHCQGCGDPLPQDPLEHIVMIRILEEGLDCDYMLRVFFSHKYTICPRSSDSFYIISYYIKWVTASWTYSSSVILYDWNSKITGSDPLIIIKCVTDPGVNSNTGPGYVFIWKMFQLKYQEHLILFCGGLI